MIACDVMCLMCGGEMVLVNLVVHQRAGFFLHANVVKEPPDGAAGGWWK